MTDLLEEYFKKKYEGFICKFQRNYHETGYQIGVRNEFGSSITATVPLYTYTKLNIAITEAFEALVRKLYEVDHDKYAYQILIKSAKEMLAK